MIRHYEGLIGAFDYDDSLWYLSEDDYDYPNESLRWVGGNQRCDIPKGCISCNAMFSGKELGEGFCFGDFDTSEVTDMGFMFNYCKLPKGFSLGDNFHTGKVTNMRGMFRHCEMSDNFGLGENFDTSQVKNMAEMFRGCLFSSEFSLGKKFDTSKVINMDKMFADCTLPKDFRLGTKFTFFSCKAKYFMFYNCKRFSGHKVLEGAEIMGFL